MAVRFLLCRHAERDGDSGITARGVEQANALGRKLSRRLGGTTGCACIVTSKAARTIATGEVVRDGFFPGVRLCQDADLDEVEFKSRPSHVRGRLQVAEVDGELFARIQRVVRTWMAVHYASSGGAEVSTYATTIVFVTHSGWIHACMRLFNLIPVYSSFFCVPLASLHPLEFPSVNECTGGRWGVETASDFERRKSEVDLQVSRVAKEWRDLPSQTWGKSRVIWRDADWLVREDVWKMERWRQCTAYMPLLAIAESDGLRCLRDLRASNVGALQKIDRAYPDDDWVKYLLYPPYVWRLHVHIQRRSCPMSYKNVYLLRDVIAMASGNPDGAPLSDGPALLVYKY